MKPGKTSKNYWIRSELAKHFEDLNFEKGVDLDRNGRIKGSERTDLNGDGKVDVSELKRFLKANRPALKNLGGFFKTFYSHGQVFSPDNPLHNLLQIESEVVPPQMVEAAYQKVMQVLNIVRRHSLQKMCPELKLETVYKTMAAVGIVLEPNDDNLFTHNINEGRGMLDCDTSSFMVQAVAHEFDWPVYLVMGPEHMFVRWDDGTNKFNMDYGEICSDRFYKKCFRILTSDEVLAQYLTNRGRVKRELGNLEGAIADYTQAIKRDPRTSRAYNNRGIAKFKLGDLKGAVADYTEAIKRDPSSSKAYYNRGNAKFKQGDLKGARADYTEAINRDPSSSEAYSNRGNAKFKLGDLKGAMADLNQTVTLNPNFSIGYYNRGKIKFEIGDLKGAMADYTEAIKRDPSSSGAYNNRGNAKFKLGDLKGAVADYTEAIERDPSSSGTYYNRGLAREKLGRHKKAREDFQKAKELGYKS